MRSEAELNKAAERGQAWLFACRRREEGGEDLRWGGDWGWLVENEHPEYH
jgi:hypothetical protein